MSRISLCLALSVLVASACTSPAPADEGTPPVDSQIVILVSLDGFRWDYMDRFDAPTLKHLAETGVVAPQGMIPCFPSKTFPNHYSIVTGLYPEDHGIIANNMYDPAMDASFSLGDRDAVADGRWYGGEPIWVTAEKQGQRTAPYFWPGSEAQIKGTRPTFWKPYDGRMTGEARVDAVLSKLDLPPARRPTFLTLYFSDVDTNGHRFGPNATETGEAVHRVDGYLARLVEGLAARSLPVNLLVVADHGMAATSSSRVVVLDDYIDLNDVQVIDRSPVLMLRPAAGKEDAVYAALKNAHPHMKVYRRAETPAHWHFRKNDRIPAIIGVADEGWSITTERVWFEEHRDRFDGGTHGYDNALQSMQALFVANGPAFRQGIEIAPFENIDLYDLLARILGLNPAPNDGDLSPVGAMLKPGILTG